jgi:hypothetical protein
MWALKALIETFVKKLVQELACSRVRPRTGPPPPQPPRDDVSDSYAPTCLVAATCGDFANVIETQIRSARAFIGLVSDKWYQPPTSRETDGSIRLNAFTGGA